MARVPVRLAPSSASVVAKALRQGWRRTREEVTNVQHAKAAAQVHDLRVALRRLLSALALAKTLGVEPPPKLTLKLERLLRSLSPLRDLEVEKKALGRLAKTAPALSVLALKLERKRAALAKRRARGLAEFSVLSAERAIERCAQALESEPAGAHPPSALVPEALARHYEKFDRRRRAVAAGDSAALHRVRVAFKQYRYAVEVALPLLPGGAKERLRTMKDFQDELGAIQDASVLAQTLRRMKLSGALGRSAQSGVARALKQELHQRERAMLVALGAQLAAQPPAFSDIFA